MKEITALFFISIFVFSSLKAQDSTKQKQDIERQKVERFGFRLGINGSGMKLNEIFPTETIAGKVDPKSGFLFGFILRIPLTKELFLQPEYVFIQRRSEVNMSKIMFTFNYLSAPLLLNYHFAKRLSLLTGPQIDLLITAKEKNNSTSVNITHETEARSFGAVIGLTYRLIKSIDLETRYYYGVSHIGLINNTTEFLSRTLSLSAAINF